MSDLPTGRAATERRFPASLAQLDGCANLEEVSNLIQGDNIQIFMDSIIRNRQRRVTMETEVKDELIDLVHYQHREILRVKRLPYHSLSELPKFCHQKLLMERKIDDIEKHRILHLETIHQLIRQLLDNYVFENGRIRKDIHVSLSKAINRDYATQFPIGEYKSHVDLLRMEYQMILEHFQVPHLSLENERLGRGLAVIEDSFIIERRVRSLYEDFVLRELHLLLMIDTMQTIGLDPEPTREEVNDYFESTGTVRDHFHTIFSEILKYGNPIRSDRLSSFNNWLRNMINWLTPVRQRGLQRIRNHESQNGPIPDGIVRMLQEPPPQNLFDENNENQNLEN